MAKGIEFFDIPNKRIYFGVGAGTETEYSVQEVGSYIIEELKKQHWIHQDEIFTWSGFDELPLGDRTGVVLILLDGWTIWTEDQGSPHTVRFAKGVISSELTNFPLGQPTNITWIIADSTVSSLANAQTLEDLKFITESATRPHHTGFGKVIYWNPTNGDDTSDGLSELNAVKTFVKAQDLATDGGHDMIFIMPDTSVEITFITENITLSKKWLFLRSVGKHIEFRTTSGVPINVTGYGCQLESFALDGTDDGGTNSLITVSGDFCELKNLFTSNSTEHGIVFTGTENGFINNCKSNGNTLDGIRLNDSKFTEIDRAILTSNGSDGIEITSTVPSASIGINIRNTTSITNTGFNVNVGTNVVGTLIDDKCIIANDGGGRISDNGTSTTDAEIRKDTDIISQLVGNDQEWVSPGLLKIYDSGGKVGGTTVAEFETRTSAGVQTFIIADVKQYIRTK